MLLRSLVILVAIFLLFQFNRAQTPSTPPGDLKLLPGYSSTEGVVKDGKIAKFARTDGFTITYLSSAPKNFYERSFKSGNDIVWLKNQTLNGHGMRVAWIKSGEMIVVVDDTHMFRAKPEKLDQVADFLLLVASVPAIPGMDATMPVLSNRHGLSLLPGFDYKRGFSKDSSSGSFVRDDGYTFGHDIGRMAANRAKQYFRDNLEQLRERRRISDADLEDEWRRIDEKVEWRQRLNINGDDLMIVYLKDTTLIASFDQSSANFIGKVDSFDQMTDFLLTVLTYQPKTSNKLPK